MRVLVVGGAGYIGSFMVQRLIERGIETIVFDNLSTGHRDALHPSALFIKGDLSDKDAVRRVFGSMSFDAVMHFASFILVEESVCEPMRYYQNNVANTIGLLEAMMESGVERLIFSSSAAVFGDPESVPINEHHPKKPVNPYGWTKCMVEQILEDASRASRIRYVSLRYFNASGGHPDGNMGEDHYPETHLIPKVLKSILSEDPDKAVTLFGTDYDTPDGTCIRDYIHVMDLAAAHLLALDYLKNGGRSDVFNLGSGQGSSVLEVVRTAEKVTGRPIPVTKAPRRSGDPPILVASSKKIIQELGWKSEYPELETIIETAWKWHTAHPCGYRKELNLSEPERPVNEVKR